MINLTSAFRYCRSTALGVCTLAFCTTANATFMQTQDSLEADANIDGTTDPFVFVFSSLAAPVTNLFTLDLEFFHLDMGGNGSSENLSITISSMGADYDLGLFPLTIGPDCGGGGTAFDACGTGNLALSFADIGDVSFSDPLSITLTPSEDVNPYGVLNYVGTDQSDIIGSVSLTLAYEEARVPVPAPATLALFGLGLAGLGWSRRKKA